MNNDWMNIDKQILDDSAWVAMDKHLMKRDEQKLDES